ncbi:MAG: hypothetical protein ACLPN1_05375 [Dissulfurispiraceae bacterium]
MRIKVGVLAYNGNGAPEIFTTAVDVTKAQHCEGKHYDIAKDRAYKRGYGGEDLIAFDEKDPAAKFLAEHLVFFQGTEKGIVKVERGVSSETQLDPLLLNGTLRKLPDKLAMTIETNLEVPKDFTKGGEEAVAAYVERMLIKAASVVPGLSFVVRIGENKNGE